MRTLGLTLLLLLTLLVPGCGNVFVRGSWGNGAQTVSGFVTTVQFTVVSDGNASTHVTVVTLTNNLVGTSETFCGDQRTQFPLNNFVQATFMPGQPCSNLFDVVIRIN